ncbi:MAG: antibiotic biosynthesis monooxygenase [Sphingobacterium hotanense]
MVSGTQSSKKYIDEVFTAGHQNGIYANDGRSRKNPEINYGTGGLMHGKKYMVNSTWNAPNTAFTLPGEFFNQTSVDDGILFGFHKMNQFARLERVDGFHFHDLEKNAYQKLPPRLYSTFKAYINRSKSNRMIYITAIIKAKSEDREEVSKALQQMVTRTREEKACVQYDLHQGKDDRNTFIFYEIWTD